MFVTKRCVCVILVNFYISDELSNRVYHIFFPSKSLEIVATTCNKYVTVIFDLVISPLLGQINNLLFHFSTEVKPNK